jgi:aspartate-semialdehyde dehydrogenase
MKGVRQLENERKNIKGELFYPYPIDLNVIPHGGSFLDNGYTTEEMKLIFETKKILDDNHLRITATVVRVPVFGGHSESVNIEFAKDFDLTIVRDLLKQMPGVVIEDDVDNLVYPMPLYAYDRDEVCVGRLRRDESNPNSLNLWIVSDNLRKGAATNAVQIAEYLITNEII